MLENRTETARRSPTLRSRVTNGTDILPDIDGRSAIARRFKDIASQILTDQGGEDRCSESRKQLIRRFAATAVLAERMEARLANGEEINITEHSLLCSTLARLVSRIGIDRVARDITPSLNQYLRASHAAKGAEMAPNGEDEPAGEGIE
jgi:hypothetical protein